MISRDQQKNRARGAAVFFALAALAMSAGAQFRPAMEKKYAEMSEAVRKKSALWFGIHLLPEFVYLDTSGTKTARAAAIKGTKDRFNYMRNPSQRAEILTVSRKGNIGSVIVKLHVSYQSSDADGKLHDISVSTTTADTWMLANGRWKIAKSKEVAATVYKLDGKEVHPSQFPR